MSDETQKRSAELVATCNSLGYSDGELYYKDAYCEASLVDLILFLKRDDDSHEIRRQLGRMQVMQSDLIKLLKSLKKDDKQLLNILIRLMVNLTMPALIVFEEEIPADTFARKNYLEIIGHLQGYKLAFCEEGVWKVLSEHLRDFLSMEWERRLEEDSLFIERLLVLVRNILHVPVNTADELRTDDDASVHDRILWELHKSGLDDLILFIANSDEYQEFCLHSLEIISLMMRDQDPSQLASSGAVRSWSEKQKDEAVLIETRKKELEQRKAMLAKQCTSRHSRFGGTFCVKGVKSISERDLIVHRPINDLKAVDFDQNKSRARKAKNKRPVEDTNLNRRSTLSIRLFLRDLCVEFLRSAYNSIMRIVKDKLNRSHEKDHDESYYLWCMRFFMEFNRYGDFQVELVSETMSVPTFHYVQTQMETYYEMIKNDKPKWLLWSKRMHLGLRAYKELMMTLQAMDSVTDENVKKSAKVIKTNLFYMVEYRDLPWELLNRYNEVTMPKTYLKDLVEMTHVFLKMLEKHIKVYSHLVVQKKKRKSIKKKKNRKQEKSKKPEESTESLDVIWDKLITDLTPYISGSMDLPESTMPFDAASDVPIEDQKEVAIRRIQKYLKTEQGPQALALLRAAREVWPEGDVFGANNEADQATLKEILIAQLPVGAPLDGVPGGRHDGLEGEEEEEASAAAAHNGEEEDEKEEEEEEEEEEITHATTSGRSEQQLDLGAFVMKFTGPKVLKAYGLILRTFDTNTTYTNHCVVKMLHRIAYSCKMAPLLYQLSMFRDFQRILNTNSESMKELRKFAVFVLRKFFQVAANNDKVFAELLFWKVPSVAYEIEEGYGTHQSKQFESRWTDEQNEQLKALYNEYKDRNEPGEDVIDLIFEHLSDQSKTRRQIIGQLKRLDIVDSGRLSLKKKGRVTSKEWGEEELEELRQLYHRFQQQEADDVVSRIVDNLSVRRPKARVIDKLVEIGVVSDKSQLKKKCRRRKQTESAEGQAFKTPAHIIAEDSENEEESAETHPSDGDISVHSTEPVEYILLIASSKKELLGPIKWIADDLKDIATDRDTGTDVEAVPLVPITQENHDALENPIFIRLLKALGLQPPQIGQETYWRYPASLNGGTCRKRAQLLRQAFDENNDRISMGSHSDESEESVNDPRSPQILSPEKEIDSSMNAIGSSVESKREDDQPTQVVEKRKLEILSDDEDDSKTVAKKSRKTFVIDSDSE